MQIEKTQGRGRLVWLVLSIVSTCTVLFIFKYCDFFIANFNGVARLLDWNYAGRAGCRRSAGSPVRAAWLGNLGDEQAAAGDIPLHWRHYQQLVGPAHSRRLSPLGRALKGHGFEPALSLSKGAARRAK